MGSVAQAVLEFDEAVRVPWRPPLSTVPVLRVVPPVGSSPRGQGAVRAAPIPPPSAEASQARRRVPVRAPRPTERCGRCEGTCSSGPLRLTRRARRLLGLLAGSAVVAVAWLGPLAPEDDGFQLAGVASTVVQPGDTLWSIARSVAGDVDVRVVVDEIQRLNGMEDAALVPGQVLELP